MGNFSPTGLGFNTSSTFTDLDNPSSNSDEKNNRKKNKSTTNTNTDNNSPNNTQENIQEGKHKTVPKKKNYKNVISYNHIQL